MKACYLKLNDGTGRFEKADEYVFQNRTFAIDSLGEPRYTGDFILIHDNGFMEIAFVGPTNAIGIICRMLGEQLPTNVCSSKGYYDEPTHIYFKRGRSEFLYDLQNGYRWKKAG